MPARSVQPRQGGDLLSWVYNFLPVDPLNAYASPDRAFASILDECGVAAILLDEGFSCLYATTAATGLINLGVVFEMQERRLICPLDPFAFRQNVLDGLKLKRSDLDLVALDAAIRWQIRIIPLPISDNGSKSVLLLIKEISTGKHQLSSQRVRMSFDLTPVESELVADLANGLSVKEYAVERGVSIHTVRNQLKSVFSKLDTHCQKDLIAQVIQQCAAN